MNTQYSHYAQDIINRILDESQPNDVGGGFSLPGKYLAGHQADSSLFFPNMGELREYVITCTLQTLKDRGVL